MKANILQSDMRLSVFSALLILLFLTSPSLGLGQTDSTSISNPASTKPKFEMMMYQMVLIKTGPTPSKDSIISKRLGEGHMANIKKMADMGKLVLAGPFGDKGDLRGIFIMDVANKEEAEKLCQEDPAIKAGALSIEIKPWWGPKGLTYIGKEEPTLKQ